jgi:hypothetical protein
LTAFEVLKLYEGKFDKVADAFRTGLSLEDCIAILEGEGDIIDVEKK